MRLSALSLLLFCSVNAHAQWRDSSPVRGAWLRPPSTSISTLEPELQNFANAGITDLYLETFYWGLSTGKQGVFNRRFTFDYLDLAINMAARHGIRVHAWIESGYWQFQSVGAYNFINNPEWRVINTSTGAIGGDIADQVFANLAHPGVQAKLRAYCTELAQYPGLWSVQTDYHRLPIDNNTSDAYTAPWTYDTYSNTAFQAIFGPSADINTTARTPGQSNWTNFLNWRRNGITECANQMRQGVIAGGNDVLFSCAIFASAMTSAGQLSKCQNWPAWASAGYVDQIVPMAYGSTTNAISADITTTLAGAAGKQVVIGLALTGSGPRPSLTSQLNLIKTRGIEDYIIWEGNAFDTAQTRIDNLAWVNNSTKMRADFDNNGTVDKRDWALFAAIYDGIPEAGTGRMDMNSDGVINQTDSSRVREQLRKSRFGPYGIVDSRDIIRFNAAQNGSTTTNSNKSLYNLDGDGDVDSADRFQLNFFGSTTPQIFVDVDLQDTSLLADNTYTISLRDSSDVEIYSVTEKAKTNGQIILYTPGAGNYRVSVKYGTWLRKTSSVNVVATDIAVPMSLVNGDIDGDNFIGLDDFNLLSSSFNTEPSDPNFNPLCDLDNDLFIGLDDFNILSSNFNLEGDN